MKNCISYLCEGFYTSFINITIENNLLFNIVATPGWIYFYVKKFSLSWILAFKKYNGKMGVESA
jgi:hypothetical protein